MEKSDNTVDRYVSFEGIKCNQNADLLIGMLESNLNNQLGDDRWHTYFSDKRNQQHQRGHDNLHFIGNQLNMLFEYFKQCEDQPALDLLYKIEQECC
ncbi:MULTISPECIES: N(2)-fixation sustaining protein CowN [Vibrio]|uniref:N(2)-fixation sustaining protein CowN n=2 Tax=Vibrio TaxID=662 RepID=A0A7X4LHV4_9VIBR|nr:MULTISPECIES: N(2)-fixation sustaining protein CowN [Vibrio]MBF8999588.1 N(2)-fixation sustaining protein CowN [Vibrio nitrifigilis]MZI92156.1 N(2)-fixation sustaining protein CowN [Vibrio eleionomae]